MDVHANSLRHEGGIGARSHSPHGQTRKSRPGSKDRADAHVVPAGVRVGGPQLRINGTPHEGSTNGGEEQRRRVPAC